MYLLLGYCLAKRSGSPCTILVRLYHRISPRASLPSKTASPPPNIPSSKLDESINVAVWNIREFGKVRRTDAAIHYIAEILGQFDLIALVELRDNLEDLGKVLPILGPSWDVVYSDFRDPTDKKRSRPLPNSFLMRHTPNGSRRRLWATTARRCIGRMRNAP